MTSRAYELVALVLIAAGGAWMKYLLHTGHPSNLSVLGAGLLMLMGALCLLEGVEKF